VVDALAYVKPLSSIDADAFFRKLEYFLAGLVAAGLLGGDYLVEGYFQLRRSGSK
jgi:hypothetical protein